MHSKFMRQAIRISLAKMRANCGGPFGAVIVKNGRVVGKGWNQVTTTNDPTAHAEVTAIRDACQRLKTFQLDGCDLYTSCEPCPMCLAAIYWARIDTVYFGNTRKDAARIEFDDDLIYREIGLPLRRRKLPMTQLLRNEALAAFQEWKNKADKIRY
jgi:guanine deaminase